MNALARKDWTPPHVDDGWPLGRIELTSEEVQRYLDVSPERIRQWLARGHISRLGSSYDMGSILNYLWRRQQNGELDS